MAKIAVIEEVDKEVLVQACAVVKDLGGHDRVDIKEIESIELLARVAGSVLHLDILLIKLIRVNPAPVHDNTSRGGAGPAAKVYRRFLRPGCRFRVSVSDLIHIAATRETPVGCGAGEVQYDPSPIPYGRIAALLPE